MSSKVQVKPMKKKMNLFIDIKRNKGSYLLALPALIYVFIYGYATLPYMFIAFQEFNFRTGLFDSQFIGFANFQVFIQSPRAFQVIFTTLYLNFLFLLFGTIIAVFFALLISEAKGTLFKKINQSIFIFPHFLSWIVVAYIVFALFSTDFGLVNTILERLGMESVRWYSTPEPWTWILVGTRVWRGTGISTVIFLAAITGIDTSLYEAAYVDGATTFQRIIKLTLPLIMPTVMILTLLNIGRFFHGDFGMIYAIIRDNGVLFPTTDIIDTFVFRLLRRTGNPSQAMAVALFQSVMGFILVFTTNAITRKKYQEGALY